MIIFVLVKGENVVNIDKEEEEKEKKKRKRERRV